MSKSYIDAYFRELDTLRRAGALTEPTVSQAFGQMLKDWGRSRDLIFLQQFDIPGRHGRPVKPDGVLLHDIRVRFGVWEAKHDSTDIDAEIAAKRKKGYPLDNILFENTRTAVLYQHEVEAMRADMQDRAALEKLLKLFFAYERREIADFRKAVATFRQDLPAVLEALRSRIDAAYDGNAAFAAKAAAFLAHCRDAINPAVTEADVREMLIQHILTEDIFNAVFDNTQFHRENNVAKKLYELEEAFFTGAVKHDAMAALRPYYAAIKANAAAIAGHGEKQTFLKVIYENFYKVYDPKKADRLGVVYTPNEIVRFMVEGADWLCREHFGKGLIDEGVNILDPAAGTGTFVVELLNFFRGQPPAAIHRKYTRELHANEVAILPYYVANLNIEATYADIAGQYAEYPNLCFVDTLDNVAALGLRRGHIGDLFATTSEENARRVRDQNAKPITLVIGNPPYNAWQENFNNRNPNRAYKRIDESIRNTYAKLGTAQNKIALYDMYVRFLRWATDRVENDGMIAFVTNRNFLDSRTYDGFRKCASQDFADIYVMDLGGDVREDPRISGTKHNVFGIQTGVAIAFFVKKAKQKQRRIFYARRPQLDTAEDKLTWLAQTRAQAVRFERLTPDKAHNWLDLTENDWGRLTPLAEKVAARIEPHALFKLYSNGLQTKRDEWAYDRDRAALEAKARFLVETYEATRGDPDHPGRSVIKWDADLTRHAAARTAKCFEPARLTPAAYRPFDRRWVYLDPHLNSRTFRLPGMFPPGAANTVIAFSDVGHRAPWYALAADGVIDLHFGPAVDAFQCVSRYRYTPSGERIDNITDWGLAQFVKRYGKAAGVTKDAIFAYVYAALHDPLWRETYAINLKRELPRIPLHPGFRQWADWGQTLLDLHIGYEAVEPWPLTRRDAPDAKARADGLSPRPILKSDAAAGTVTLDSETVLSGLPPEAWAYRLGNRSGVEWVLDQHKEKTPKDPTIRERFNTYRFADHKEKVADLIARVARVSVETMAIVAAMRDAEREG